MSATLDLFQSTPWLWLLTAAGLGLIVGSFLNVVIYRVPVMLQRSWEAQCAELKGESPPAPPPFNLVRPASTCRQCGHRVRARENVPVLSYLALRGRCTACKTRISPRYPVVEALTGLLTAYAAWRFGITAATLGAWLFLWLLVALTFIDLDTQLLPDNLTLPLVWLGLLFNLNATFVPLPEAVVGAVAGYLVLWSVYWLFKLLTGKEGMGYGDFKLLSAVGAWLGWQMLPLVILLSSLVGAAVGIVLIATRRNNRHTPIPFGPYLAGGGLIALFWGDAVVRTYLASF